MNICHPLSGTRIEIGFAGGKYSFRFPLPQIIELERKAGGKSIFAIYG